MDGHLGTERTLDLLRATGVGVGAIVGGGILALAGVAYAATGPGAIVAFALNGLIALLTAFSYAEMSRAFPESGGTYVFAKKVLSVESAFAVGWVVWFASILAAVLYALGFASYFVLALGQLWSGRTGSPPHWLAGRPATTLLAAGILVVYSVRLMRQSSGGGQWETMGKILVFSVLIAGGFWALAGRSMQSVRADLSPFFPFGATGLFQAMGYTFITLQGADLIAAVAGEVRDPGRTIPRAMFLSLAIALAIYLPLLFLMATVGVESGGSIAEMSARNPETIVALAAKNYMGAFGFWLVVVAAILSMLSALQMNLFAASRIAQAMALDRTLPVFLGRLHDRLKTPIASILASLLTILVILLVISDVALAGAISSLIFLLSYSLAHGTAALARRRMAGRAARFRASGFPLVPAVGGLACIALAFFQCTAVPSAALLVGAWLCLGGILFLALFARRARVFDASAEARDPFLVQLRGRNPLVLVPIANPSHARSMVEVASVLAPPVVGRVLLLTVVTSGSREEPHEARAEEIERRLFDAQAVLRESLAASFAVQIYPEALTTVAQRAWTEIARVSRTYRCESLLVGFSRITEPVSGTHLEELISAVDSNVVILRAPQGWRLSEAREILVPLGGRGGHDMLRARLLGSLCRTHVRKVTFLRVLPETAEEDTKKAYFKELATLVQDEVPGHGRMEVVSSPDVGGEIVRRAERSDLLILGLQRLGRRRRLFGELTLHILRQTACPIILIGRRR